jgi:hypothetical protein
MRGIKLSLLVVFAAMRASGQAAGDARRFHGRTLFAASPPLLPAASNPAAWLSVNREFVHLIDDKNFHGGFLRRKLKA